jgi:ABC-type antimicrobial peptide transport system permease subunit
VHGLSLPWVVVVVGLGCAVLVALMSAAVPAFRAARLQVVTALAER